MAIQWYPGHMHKANKEMLEVLPNVDVVIEVLDARLPYSSANPRIAELCQKKPSLKIFSKADLADETMTGQWQQYYEQQGAKTLALGLHKGGAAPSVLSALKALAPNKGIAGKTLLAMISGIPNVGKSTLINALAGRQIAKTGNEPAVTKAQQRIKIEEHIVLLDTPGILWPKIYNENSGYRLATTGAIKDTAMSNDDVGYFAAEFMINYYPDRLKERFNFEELPQDPLKFLEEIGRMRGSIGGGGQVDYEKICKILLTEIRDGTLGKLTFENPEQVTAEQVLVEEAKAEREAKKAARKSKRKRR